MNPTCAFYAIAISKSARRHAKIWISNSFIGHRSGGDLAKALAGKSKTCKTAGVLSRSRLASRDSGTRTHCEPLREVTFADWNALQPINEPRLDSMRQQLQTPRDEFKTWNCVIELHRCCVCVRFAIEAYWRRRRRRRPFWARDARMREAENSLALSLKLKRQQLARQRLAAVVKHQRDDSRPHHHSEPPSAFGLQSQNNNFSFDSITRSKHRLLPESNRNSVCFYLLFRSHRLLFLQAKPIPLVVFRFASSMRQFVFTFFW